MNIPAPPAPSRLLRLGSVEELTGLKKSTLYALCAEKKFPAPVRLSARAVGWRSELVERWIAERVVARPE